MNAKHKEALRKNRVALVESLRVEDIRSHMIQDGILTISHFQSITAKPTWKEQAEEFLDILETRGPNAYMAFTRALRYNYSFLYASLMGKGTERELDLVEENKVLKDENKTYKQYLHTIYRVFQGLLSRHCTVDHLMAVIHREKENLEKLLFPAKASRNQPKGQKTISSKAVSTQKQAAPRIQTAKLATKPSEKLVRPKSNGPLQVQQHNSGDSSKGSKSRPLSKTPTTKITSAKPAVQNSPKSTSTMYRSVKERAESKLHQIRNTNRIPSKSPTEKEKKALTVTMSGTTTPKQIDIVDYHDQTQHVFQHTVETKGAGNGTSKRKTQKETDMFQKDRISLRSEVEAQHSRTRADILQKPAQRTPGTTAMRQNLAGTFEEDLSQKAKQSMAAMDQEGQGSTNLKKPCSNTQGIKTVPTHNNYSNSKHNHFTGRVGVSGTAGVNKSSTHPQVVGATSQGDRNQAGGKAAYCPGKVTVSGSSGSSTAWATAGFLLRNAQKNRATKSPNITRWQNTPSELTRTQTSKSGIPLLEIQVHVWTNLTQNSSVQDQNRPLLH